MKLPKTVSEPNLTQYFRAKQNAERLHGAAHKVELGEYNVKSTVCSLWIPYKRTMKKAKKPNSKPKNGGKQSRAISVPAAKSSRFMNQDAIIKVGKGGSLTVTHRELLKSHVAEAEFCVFSHALNPGLSLTFPWLASLANNYERYRFDKLEIVYEPSCPTTSAGMMFLAVDYDPRDTPPEEFKEVMSMHSAVSGPLWAPLRHRCTFRDLNTGLLRKTRRGIHVLNDLETYDSGNLLIGNDGGTVGKSGYIFLEYTVTLFTPQLNPKEVIEAATRRIYNNTGTTPVAPLGGINAGLKEEGGLNCTVQGGDSLLFTDPGEYMIQSRMIGTTFTGLTPTLINAQFVSGITNAAATVVDYLFKVNVKSGDVVRIQAVPAATLTATVLRIAPYLYELLV